MFQTLPIEKRVFKGSKYDFLVLNRSEIKDFSPLAPTIVISVTDPEKPAAEIFASTFLLDVLKLKFDDVDDANKFRFAFEETTDIPMNPEDAKKILSFLDKNLSQVSLIICQCEQGVSRSPAIAAALSKILQNDDEYFLKNFWPNRRVYNLLIEEYKNRQ